MKRRFPPYYPANGVRTDFEALLQRFTETDSVRYEEFAEIWRDMKFSQIYAGRQDDREAQDFVDECLKIALKFYLPPCSFQIRVGGLYILYGIYFTQPILRKRKIRVIPDIWNKILEFQAEAHLQEHLDVEFIFHKLRYFEAFEFCATESHVYPNKSDTIVEDATTREEFKEEQSMLYDLFSTDVLEQLAAVHQHYHHMKVAMENQKNISRGGKETDMPAKSLDVIQQDLVPSITKAVIHYQEKRKTVLNTKKHTAETESEGEHEGDYSVFLHIGEGSSRQSSVKSKAYKKLAKSSRSRRHRQTQEESSETEDSPQKRRRKQRTSSTGRGQNQESQIESSYDTDGNQVKDEVTKFDEVGDNILMSMPTLTEEEPSKSTASCKGKFPQKGKKSAKTTTKGSKGSKGTKSNPPPRVAPDLDEDSNIMPSKLRVKLKSGAKARGRPQKRT